MRLFITKAFLGWIVHGMNDLIMVVVNKAGA